MRKILGEERGYFLIEVLIAFMVLVMVLQTTIPLWIQVKYRLNERFQKNLALQLVQNELNLFRFQLENETEEEVENNSYLFHKEWEVEEVAVNLEKGSLSVWWTTARGQIEKLELEIYRRKEPELLEEEEATSMALP